MTIYLCHVCHMPVKPLANGDIVVKVTGGWKCEHEVMSLSGEELLTPSPKTKEGK